MERKQKNLSMNRLNFSMNRLSSSMNRLNLSMNGLRFSMNSLKFSMNRLSFSMNWLNFCLVAGKITPVCRQTSKNVEGQTQAYGTALRDWPCLQSEM